VLHQVLARLSIELFEFRNCWVAATVSWREARADAVDIWTADPAISSTPRMVIIVFRIVISINVTLGRDKNAPRSKRLVWEWDEGHGLVRSSSHLLLSIRSLYALAKRYAALPH
jgi:hypothetical protein